jgi:hypothetical protein
VGVGGTEPTVGRDVMILFLDFDGVLHPEPCYRDQAFCQLPLVEGVLREFATVEIVVSSTWRLDWKDPVESTTQMRKHFSADIAPQVIGVTPDHRYLERSTAPQGLGEYQREWECRSWLRQHRTKGTPWLALDDRVWWFRPDSPNVMIVPFYSGFTADHEAELRRRLHALEQRTQVFDTQRKAGQSK